MSVLVGASIGLSLKLPAARHVLEDHAWTIAVESEVGAGTVFTLRLPLPAQPASE